VEGEWKLREKGRDKSWERERNPEEEGGEGWQGQGRRESGRERKRE